MKETNTTLPIILSTILVIIKKASLTHGEYLVVKCSVEASATAVETDVVVELDWVIRESLTGTWL